MSNLFTDLDEVMDRNMFDKCSILNVDKLVVVAVGKPNKIVAGTGQLLTLCQQYQQEVAVLQQSLFIHT